MELSEKIKIARKTYTLTRDGIIMNIWYGRILKTSHTKLGYAYIRIKTRNNKEKRLYIHQWLGYEFLYKPKRYTEINHIDGNPGNNRIENLEWCTHRQNIRARFKKDPSYWQKKDRMKKNSQECRKQWRIKQQLTI